MTHGPLSWRELVERDKQKSEDAQAAIAAMQLAPQEPVAWLYAHPDDPFPPSVRTDRHDKYDFAAMAKRGWTETPLYAHPPAPQWQGIETAPRDGRAILVGCWVGSRWSWWQTFSDGGPLGNDGEFGDEPTHWADAPTPPAGGSDAE